MWFGAKLHAPPTMLFVVALSLCAFHPVARVGTTAIHQKRYHAVIACDMPAPDSDQPTPPAPDAAAVDAVSSTPTDPESEGKPLVFIGAIAAIIALGGIADPASVLDAQKASMDTLASIEAPKIKPYMSGQSPDRFPFPNRPPDSYFAPASE